MSIPLAIISDGLFAAIAAIGFGSISNISKNSFLGCAILAATGHMTRFVLMEYFGVHIVQASFFAGLAIGLLSLPVAKWRKCPVEALSFPALLPMIPGKFAYNMVFSLIMCLQTANKPELHDKYIKMQEMFFSNTLVASTVIFMLAVGATFPMFLFPHRAFSLTRH